MDQPWVRLMMPMQSVWTFEEAFFVWLMWAVMMGAMMLPSAIPMILVHNKISARNGTEQDNLYFIAAYLLVWSLFSFAAASLQWWLQWLGQISHMLVMTNDSAIAIILILVGVTQWTSLKDRCLGRCRAPIGFLTTEWRSGSGGAFVMGMHHGVICVGCCWALMVLLFVFGVMNLVGIGLLTLFVAAEKLIPQGPVLAKLGGVGLILWGLAFLVAQT
ncbi:DUF2182 domain-containing protein [Hahella sp. CCB-MM4]|uniref:DUF2182 domain-containing protein n=1 Tax=Hahella sp. (strain CCB-MM4) TaxID=1926491 RepID=UPI00143D0172|nr:DUF2182 domain-containing protein [Hahella sp. CCB-MM4]